MNLQKARENWNEHKSIMDAVELIKALESSNAEMVEGFNYIMDNNPLCHGECVKIKHECRRKNNCVILNSANIICQHTDKTIEEVIK